MKHLFLFFAAFHLFTQISHGKPVNQLHIVFVSNVVDPNEYEMQTLINLAAYPFIRNTNSSLITRFGLLVNYSMIFSSDPENVITLRGLDMDRYSKDYFRVLVPNHTTDESDGTSLKGLRKALKIATESSIILLAANSKPRDTVFLMEILEDMVAKTNPVIVLQIEEDGSIAELPTTSMDINLSNYIPQDFGKNNESLIPEFSAIMNVTGNLLDAMFLDALTEEIHAIRVPYLLEAIPKMNYDFAHPATKKRAVFVYDMIDANERDLEEISVSMETNYQARHKAPYNVTEQYSIIFSFEPDTIITIDKSAYYTAKDFRTMIDSRIKKNSPKKPSLKGLRKALQTIPPFSWIVYYVKNKPDDDIQILPEIVQLIYDKKALVKILTVGLGHSSGNPLPVLYKTIVDASKMATYRFQFHTPTNWIESMDIFQQRYVETSDSVKSVKNETIRTISMSISVFSV